MSMETFVVVLLFWIVAGLVVAIGFGMVARHQAPDDESEIAASAGTLKYFRKNKRRSHSVKTHMPELRHGKMKSA